MSLKTTMKQELIVLNNDPYVDEKKTSRANSPSSLETDTNLQRQVPRKSEQHLDTLLHEGDLKCKDAKGGSWKKAHVAVLVGCIKYKRLFQTKYVVIPFEDVIKICGTWTELHIIEDKRMHIFRACK